MGGFKTVYRGTSLGTNDMVSDKRLKVAGLV